MDIDRRNMLSTKDDNEIDKNELLVERDMLMEKMHDSEIHQLANKYKLDKIAEQLNELQTKLVESDQKRGLTEFVKKVRKCCRVILKSGYFLNFNNFWQAADQLLVVREDMGKTRDFGKLIDSLDYVDDTISVSSKRSSSNKKVSNLEVIERETGESLLGKEKFDELKGGRSPRSTRKESKDKSEPQSGYGISKSVSTDTAYEARLAELRLRSASPVPRKITNYPDPPPSMIFSKRFH